MVHHAELPIINETTSQEDRWRKFCAYSKTKINPFSFGPEQLAMLREPEDISLLVAIGGVSGLCQGLQTNPKTGIAADSLDGSLTHPLDDGDLDERKGMYGI
jgi:hypothetical protein